MKKENTIAELLGLDGPIDGLPERHMRSTVGMSTVTLSHRWPYPMPDFEINVGPLDAAESEACAKFIDDHIDSVLSEHMNSEGNSA